MELTIEAAESYYDPGEFTAFIGYEWTATEGGANLHRVVIYRDDGVRAGVMEPYTTLSPSGSPDPKDLWEWMQSYEDRTGGRLLAIGHNGNLSNGVMFPVIDSFTGRRVDRAYVETRARWEPLYEITQIKGDGETHPFLSPDDAFADYETWDQGNLDLSELKEECDAPIRIRAERPSDRAPARTGAGHQPLQSWPDRCHGQPHGSGHTLSNRFFFVASTSLRQGCDVEIEGYFFVTNTLLTEELSPQAIYEPLRHGKDSS